MSGRASRASRCSPSAPWRSRRSRARAARCCSPATRCTPTSGPSRRWEGSSGGCCASLGQEHGFPVPEGGAGRLTDALVRRLEARGGRVVCSTAVTSVEVRGRRAVAVRTEHGDEIGAARAVLADVGAPALYGSLVRQEHLPARVLEGMRRVRVRPRDGEDRLGARRPGPVVAPSPPGVRARCTSATRSTISARSRRSSRPGASRQSRSCSSGR